MNRRHFLHASAGGAALAVLPSLRALAAAGDLGPAGLPSGALESATLAALPGKLPLIKKTWRPPNFETPTHYFNDAFTPNDAFFVRYHLARIPEPIDAANWRLEVGGPAVDQSGAVGDAPVPQVTDQHRTHSVVTAQQISAADHQNIAPGRLEIIRRDVDLRTFGHTMPLMTNFESSLPVLPS